MALELKAKKDFSSKTVGPLWPPRYFINSSTKETRFHRPRNATKRTWCSGTCRAFHLQLPENSNMTDLLESVRFSGEVLWMCVCF